MKILKRTYREKDSYFILRAINSYGGVEGNCHCLALRFVLDLFLEKR